ncbi:response regulator [Mesorhizobium erdmanii]|uniref:response regulator n=1 Tax=Mesorhizobium erdmanii TaxID=1777866 RepID=UPI00047AB649|nr:response regulator [Mesorhizobium erdmanii]
MKSRSTHVSVVDDDESVREALPDLLRSFGATVEAFASADEFLNSNALEITQCMVLDIAMPGMTGPELRHELVRRGRQIPTIFITAIKDDDVRTRLMRDGAVECLFKPFTDEDLHQALRLAGAAD